VDQEWLAVLPPCFRQAFEQNFTSSQLLAHRLRQLIGLAHAAHGLAGNEALLPLKEETVLMTRCLTSPYRNRLAKSWSKEESNGR
jgi:hypothetical protein